MGNTPVKLKTEFSTALNRDQKDAARTQWRGELKNVWGGAGEHLYHIADKVQIAAEAAFLPALGTLAIPVVGELIEGAEWVALGVSTGLKAVLRHAATNKATDAAGGTEDDHLGTLEALGHGIKSIFPDVVARHIGLG